MDSMIYEAAPTVHSGFTAPRWASAFMLTFKSLRTACLTVALPLFAFHNTAIAADPTDELLAGLWMETANYPASSIVRFERDGDQIVGKYRQVSTPQKYWGFEVGETVIRGRVRGKVLTGQVLLKLRKDFIAKCPKVAVGWASIELNLVEPDKIYGRWLQSHFDKNEPCKILGHSWQLYGLEKINVQ